MEILLYALGAAALAAGLAGLILPVLPGALLLYAGVWLVAWAGHFQRIGWPTLLITGLLAASIWAADLAASALGAKVSGASRWAVIGATTGLVVGLFLGPLGIVLGPPTGAAAFEYWKDPDLNRALKAGGGTLLGFLVGSVVKVMLAFALLGALLIGLLA